MAEIYQGNILKRINEDGFFAKEVEISFCDSDRYKHAKLSTILRFMGDIAGLAYAHKGYSHEWLWEHGYVFLLSKISVMIKKELSTNERYTLVTWERTTKGVQWFRDFAFYDKNGEVAVYGKSTWVLANPQTRSILKPSEFEGRIHPHPEVNTECGDVIRLKPLENPTLAGVRQIYFSDLDPNDHVDNAVYASIAYDFLSDKDRERPLKEFYINFKKEALMNDKLSIMLERDGDTVKVCGEFEDKQPSFECEFRF